jgi:hypothetical protein
MDDDGLVSAAAAQGFELEERVVGDAWVWGWARGADTRWPCHMTRDDALRWMADRLQRVQVFA